MTIWQWLLFLVWWFFLFVFFSGYASRTPATHRLGWHVYITECSSIIDWIIGWWFFVVVVGFPLKKTHRNHIWIQNQHFDSMVGRVGSIAIIAHLNCVRKTTKILFTTIITLLSLRSSIDVYICVWIYKWTEWWWYV